MWVFTQLGDIWVILEISNDGRNLDDGYISLPVNFANKLREDFISDDYFLNDFMDEDWGFADKIDLTQERVRSCSIYDTHLVPHSILDTLKIAMKFLEDRCSE